MAIEKRYDSEYNKWLRDLKARIKRTQLKAALSANSEIIMLYWEIGKELCEKQEDQGWGNSVVDSLERDLSAEFPDSKRFSRRDLFYMKGFYSFYKSRFEKVQQLVAQIPWGHNILIYSKSETIEEAVFYLSETIESNWSRSILDLDGSSKVVPCGRVLSKFDSPMKQFEKKKNTDAGNDIK